MLATPSPVRRAARTSPAWLVLVLVCLGQFMVVLDATVVNVALPSIQRGLHFAAADLQWVVNAYTLTFGGLLLLGGRAADLLGRRRLFVAGIAVFSVASLIDALAVTPGMLIAGRALQGVGGALVSPAALSIITTTFAEGEARTRALGVWSGIAAGGGAIGLLLGGILTDIASWQWVFIVNVPVGALGVLLSMRYIPESRAAVGGRRSLDAWGAVTVTGGLMLAVYAIVRTGTSGWTSPTTLALGAAAVALLAAFLVIETRHDAPLMPMRIFRIRSLAGSNLVMFLAVAGMFAMFFFATIYVQEVLGYTPLRAGFAFLPVALCIGVGAGLAQVLIRVLGVRGVALLGLGLAAIGLLSLDRTTLDGSYLTQLLPGLLTIAVGMGLVFVPMTLMATTRVADEDSGLASGLLNTAQQVGGALGLAMLSTIATSHAAGAVAALHRAPTRVDLASAQLDGFHIAYVAAAVMMALAVGLLAVMVRRSDVSDIAGGSPGLAATAADEEVAA
ncbi:MAG TPA: MFS transporter [Candidatus Dormibacteraeota bacterium]